MIDLSTIVDLDILEQEIFNKITKEEDLFSMPDNLEDAIAYLNTSNVSTQELEYILYVFDNCKIEIFKHIVDVRLISYVMKKYSFELLTYNIYLNYSIEVIEQVMHNLTRKTGNEKYISQLFDKAMEVAVTKPTYSNEKAKVRVISSWIKEFCRFIKESVNQYEVFRTIVKPEQEKEILRTKADVRDIEEIEKYLSTQSAELAILDYWRNYEGVPVRQQFFNRFIKPNLEKELANDGFYAYVWVNYLTQYRGFIDEQLECKIVKKWLEANNSKEDLINVLMHKVNIEKVRSELFIEAVQEE